MTSKAMRLVADALDYADRETRDLSQLLKQLRKRRPLPVEYGKIYETYLHCHHGAFIDYIETFKKRGRYEMDGITDDYDHLEIMLSYFEHRALFS